jgi:hypothetical protein
VRAIWRREVRREHARVDAVVALRVAQGAPGVRPRSRACYAGPVLRIVIRGTFPTKPSVTRYQDLYASSGEGRVCATDFRTEAPKLKGVPLGLLQRTFDVPDSG